MCFGKKEEIIPQDAPIVEKARPYLEYRKSLSELDLRSAGDAEIAIYCLNVKPILLRELDVNEAKDLSIVKIWVRNDYSNYLLCVKHGVDNNSLLTIYLAEKLQATLKASGGGVSLISSYDKRLVINYQYETKNGETISYFDKTLGVPTPLVAKANVRLKLVNARSFVEKIDVAVKYIDMTIVKNAITKVLNMTVRDTVLSFIERKKLSFYDLPQYYTELNQEISQEADNIFDDYGLDVAEFILSDISVPNNTDTLLRNQFFAIAEAERQKAHERKMESASLDLYERKAAIHSKYPDFPMTLTEAEKDFALDRYLKRMGYNTKLDADIEDEEIVSRVVLGGGTATKERKPVAPPTFKKKSNKSVIIYSIALVLLYVIAFSCFAAGVVVGLSMLAAVTFVMGIAAVACYDKLKYGSKTQQALDKEYRQENEDYIRQQAESDGFVKDEDGEEDEEETEDEVEEESEDEEE